LEDIKKKYGNRDITRNQYYSLRDQLLNNKPIRVKTLKKILNLLKKDYSSFNRHIKTLGRGKHAFSIKFPLNLDNIDSAILVAAFMSDGNNQAEHPFYANQGFLGYKIIKATQTIIANIPWEFRNDKVRFHRILSLILTKLGVPKGNKTKLNPKIPCLIYKSEEYKKAYLTQIFDDEGHAATRKSRKIVLGRSVAVESLSIEFTESLTYKEKNYYNSLPEEIKIIVSQQPPNLLLMEFDLLNEFGIKSNMRCRGLTKYLETISADWVIEIAGIENLNRFHTNIGFSQPEKITQMEAYLSTCRKDKNFLRTKIK